MVEPLNFGAADTPTRRTIHNLPFAHNPAFTGRYTELENLREKLQKRGEVVVTQTVVVHGLGGVGKTQLAVEYAWKHVGDYDAVLWITADSPNALDGSLAALALVLGLPEPAKPEQAVQTKAVISWLHGHECWLLIADNADTEGAAMAVRDRLPPNLPGALLITSRLSRWPVNMPNLPLDFLLPEDAARYLLDRVAKEGHNAGGAVAARSLGHELGNLPLALEQAASFIVEMRWSFAKYQEQFRDARPELLSEHREGGTRYPASVAKTWSMTLEQLSPLARSLLRIAAWFAPDAIPRDVFLADQGIFSEALGGNVQLSDIAIEKALGELGLFSLIRLTGETASVHHLLQAVEQDSLDEEERKRWLVWAVRLFNAFAPESSGDDHTWGVWLLLWPHAETLIAHTKSHGVDALLTAEVANNLGLFLKAQVSAYEDILVLFQALLTA